MGRPGGGSHGGGSWRLERGSKKRIERLERAEWGSPQMWWLAVFFLSMVALYFGLVWCHCI
jgi:hypothetical protein